MTAKFRGDEPNPRILPDFRRLVDRERYEGVVLRLDHQGGYLEAGKIANSGLGAIVVLRVAEAEGGRGEAVVEFEHGAQSRELVRLVAAGGAETLTHGAHEAGLV